MEKIKLFFNQYVQPLQQRRGQRVQKKGIEPTLICTRIKNEGRIKRIYSRRLECSTVQALMRKSRLIACTTFASVYLEFYIFVWSKVLAKFFTKNCARYCYLRLRNGCVEEMWNGIDYFRRTSERLVGQTVICLSQIFSQSYSTCLKYEFSVKMGAELYRLLTQLRINSGFSYKCTG